MIWASKQGHVAIVDALIASGADMNATDSVRMFKLHLTSHKSTITARCFSSYYNNQFSHSNNSDLNPCYRHNDHDLCYFWSIPGCNFIALHCTTQSNNTALMWASLSHHADVVKTLLAHHADATVKNKVGSHALCSDECIQAFVLIWDNVPMMHVNMGSEITRIFFNSMIAPGLSSVVWHE